MSESLSGLLDLNRLFASVLVLYGPFDIDTQVLAETYAAIPEDMNLSMTMLEDDKIIRIEAVTLDGDDSEL